MIELDIGRFAYGDKVIFENASFSFSREGFTALTGAVSHFAIDSLPDMTALICCVVFTLIGARVSAVFANKASARKLNLVTGIVLATLGAAMIIVKLFI